MNSARPLYPADDSGRMRDRHDKGLEPSPSILGLEEEEEGGGD